MSSESPQAIPWEKLPKQSMRGGIKRRFVNSEKMMIGQIWFQEGDSVPAHRHDNEQVTYVISGALRFLFGEAQHDEVIVGPGEIVLIPSGMLHSASALEDTFELDIFCPPRSDWLDGSDAYMRE